MRLQRSWIFSQHCSILYCFIKIDDLNEYNHKVVEFHYTSCPPVQLNKGELTIMMESSDSYEECFYPFSPQLENNTDHWSDSVDSTFAYLSSGTQQEACAKIYKYNLANTVMHGYTNDTNHTNNVKLDKQLRFSVLYKLPVDILEKADHLKLGGTALWMLHQQCISNIPAGAYTKPNDDSKVIMVALIGAILDRYREKESSIKYFFQRFLCL